MRNIRLLISYDGTGYHGFQVQPRGLRTIQGVLEQAISSLAAEQVRVIGSGRTDSGVHALGQVVNFKTSSPIPVERWADALNLRLPADIQVLEATEVAADFHARYSALSKSYRYLIAMGTRPSPVLRRYTWSVGRSLDVHKMSEAVSRLAGTHDFKAFQTAGSSAQTTVRSVSQSRVSIVKGLVIPGAEVDGQLVAYDITADGFLYNMVRNIVGLLYRIGTGKVRPEEVSTILEARDRALVGRLAPPQGLWLMNVWY